ncbi:hypothetical protein Pelo_6042 [Pelomyxa schiedti]|nr:hypothetical protein Pelo_6042 [Pelomyxa schiedti]
MLKRLVDIVEDVNELLRNDLERFELIVSPEVVQKLNSLLFCLVPFVESSSAFCSVILPHFGDLKQVSQSYCKLPLRALSTFMATAFASRLGFRWRNVYFPIAGDLYLATFLDPRYKQRIQILQAHEMIITMDFKEKMQQLRRAPKELNRDFYFQQSLKCWDIVSYVLSNDATFVIGALEEFTTDHLDEFQGMISDINLFIDKGPHFHNFEVAHLFLCHLPQKLNCRLSWHLWAAKHAKSKVDGTLGCPDFTKKTRIDTMGQFIPEIQSAFEKDNLMKNVFILKYPAHLEVPETPKSVSFLKFSGITDYHCFLSSPGSSQIILKTTSAESCPGHIITKVVGTRSNTHQIKLSYSKRTAEQSMEQEEQGTEYSPRLQKQARRQHQPWSRRPQSEPPPQPP